jgi:hypothetical protein
MTNNTQTCDDEGAFVLLEFKGDLLDPAPLISLLSLTPVRPRKKGDPTGPARGTKIPTAKTGYCGFTTAGKGLPGSGEAHVEFLLETVESHIVEIRKIIAAQSLEWCAIFFEGRSEGQSFSDLRPELLHRSVQLGLPLFPKEKDAMTVVFDMDQSEPPTIRLPVDRS